MKNILFTLGMILSIVFTAFAQKQIPKVSSQTYDLDIVKSNIAWKGSYLFQFSEHTGVVNFKSGKLYTNKDEITGGSFIVDMTSITNEQYQKNPDNGPVEHLKNADFFDVTVYPEAHLELSKVTYYQEDNEHRFEGRLTIKGITNTIMIRALANAKTKSIKTKFKIDRKDWGITYDSKYKDSAISDAMEFDVFLQFK